MRTIYLLTLGFLLLCTSCRQPSAFKVTNKESDVIYNLSGQAVALDSIEAFVLGRMADMQIPAVSYAIVNQGALVHHQVLGYADLQNKSTANGSTLFEGASTSKPVFAFMVMMMAEDGTIDLDTPLYNYLSPESRANFDYDPRYSQITARMVLSHTTGFPNWRGNGELTIAFDPGTNFSYSGEGYQFLVKAVESVLDTDYKGLETYFQERIAEPLRMTHSKFVQDKYNLEHKAFPHFDGIREEKNHWVAAEFNAASALHTESKEFAKWLIAVMKDSLLKPSTSALMLKEQISATQAPALLSEEGAVAWTLGFAKYENSGHTVYGHEGNNDGFNCLFLFDKEKQWGLIQFNNANEVYDFGYDLFGYINKKK